jgi:hypothetical protein
VCYCEDLTHFYFQQLNDDSCSESEVKEDDDLGTESSRSRHTFEAEQKKKKKRKSHRRSSGGRVVPPKSSEDNAEEVIFVFCSVNLSLFRLTYNLVFSCAK